MPYRQIEIARDEPERLPDRHDPESCGTLSDQAGPDSTLIAIVLCLAAIAFVLAVMVFGMVIR